MRLRMMAAFVAAVVLLVPLAANAGSSRDRATGGGQILLGTQGAGNTVAFTAQGTSQLATGQVQFVDRSAGRGRLQTTFHGIVQCLRVESAGDVGMAKISGVNRDTGQPFELFVVDNGEGAKATGADMVTFQEADDVSCENEDDDDDDAMTVLARGNAQVYDAP
ncbi:MAG: hypothetical protein M3O86_05715 [Actinomycetota bacterium]|nr:hypothetical protein [Actinomycetota bacterium]